MKSQKDITKEIQEIKQLLTVQADEPLNIDEACKLLNFKKSYIYKLTHLRKLPFYSPNDRKLYFSKRELLNWIFSKKHKTLDEIQAEKESNLKRNEV
jgi:excisionase family DNA binding protein